MNIENLPLLSYLEQKYEFAVKQPFKEYSCLFIQHLLGSNISLIKSFENGGLKKDDLFILGKAYSSNQEVLRYFENNGYHYINPIVGYSTEVSYDEILKNEIRKALSSLLNKSNQQILIIDDAAKGICILHEEPFIRNIHRFKCVELTTRGIRELKKISLKCPVIDIASSYAKRYIEAPLIGNSMAIEFLKLLERWEPFYCPPNRNILIIGYGTIGKVVCSELGEFFNITVFDSDYDQIQQAIKDGIKTTNDISSFFAGIVIGCTGTSTIRLEELSRFNEVLFVNMASSDLEFGLWRFKGKKSHVINDSVYFRQELPLHELYKIEHNSKTFFLANGGFPINFTGEIDPIHPQKIQITRSLVLAATIQVLDETKCELIALNNEIQNDLIDLFKIQVI